MDLDNFVTQISVNFPKVLIEKQSVPSYVKIFNSNNEDVFLAYTKNKPTLSSEIFKKVGEDKEEFELTGSPLKLDLSLHTILDETLPSDELQLWSKDEGFHMPISNLKLVREILGQYNEISREQCGEEKVSPMWALCPATPEQPILLLMVQSFKDHFVRGIVTFEGTMLHSDINLDKFIEDFAKQENISMDMVNTSVECKYTVSGQSYSGVCRSAEELVGAPHAAVSELHASWPQRTLAAPLMTCRVTFEQEVIVGHRASPCDGVWRSLCALHALNRLLVDTTAAGGGAVALDCALIRRESPTVKRPDPTKGLQQLLEDVETLSYMSSAPVGGCLCVGDDTTSLRQCMDALRERGSSNDLTYALWDVLKDCETAEELLTLLIEALKFISTGKIRPFIDANNKTYLSKLVLKLSRGHSQANKVLKNLRANPAQALSLLAQVGVEKTMWEYTNIMSLIEHSFYIANIWTSDNRTHESIEQINQTIQDMTMSGGDFTLNPFESLSHTAEHSIRLDCESFYDEDPNELSIDEFASLKKHGLVADKKSANEVPLIADEIDIAPWRPLLMKFAQVHACLEHLCRAETSLRADFASLKPLATKLLEHYVSERSPVKTIGQLMNDPAQRVSIPITNSVVKDHLKKPVSWYRLELTKKDNATGLKRDCKVVLAFTQQPVFPPLMWQHLEPPSEEVAEMTTMVEEVKYHCTKYTHLSDYVVNKLPV